LARWLDALPDTRFQPFVVYDKGLLVWLGLGVFLFRLGARRQVGFEMGGDAEQDRPLLGHNEPVSLLKRLALGAGKRTVLAL